MGDLSKLKLAIGQVDIVEGRPSLNEAAIDAIVDSALDDGADLLVMAGSLDDASNIRIIGLNDTRIDVVGNGVSIDACGETYEVSFGKPEAECDFALCVDAEPYTITGARQAGRNLPARLGIPQVILKPAGMQDRGKKLLAFDGGSYALDADGACVVRLRDDFDADCTTFTFAGTPEVAKPCERKLLDGIVKTMQRFDRYVLGGKSKWIIGLSGGLDSSVTAALLVRAFGPDRVKAFSMSTRYNSESTRRNAESIAEKLGIVMHSGTIEPLVAALRGSVKGFGYADGVPAGIISENVQARSRANLLSTFAAIEGGVVVNNGNRIEGALGYATLYGDAIGALAPLGDLSKVDLFSLARTLNETYGFEAVPENLLPIETEQGYDWKTMPSAELDDGQKDPMKWFYHDWLISQLLGDEAEPGTTLDAIVCSLLERYVDDRLIGTDVGKWVHFYGLDDPTVFADDFEWVVRSMRSSAFKRIQGPPRIALASHASIASAEERQLAPEPSSRYRALMAKIRRL